MGKLPDGLLYSNIRVEVGVEELIGSTPWLFRTEARQECFMTDKGGVSYTYGSGRGIRTYTSVPYTPEVLRTLRAVTGFLIGVHRFTDQTYKIKLNGCFLNYYKGKKQHLGWHADDFIGMDHSFPIAIVSFGEPREIWWRKIGEKGEVRNKQLLENGSILIMPPGMQKTHEHRIPKGDRSMGPRVSMTFRRFK